MFNILGRAQTQHFPARDGLGCRGCTQEVHVPLGNAYMGASAGACVSVHVGVQGTVCMERGPCVCEPPQCYSEVLGLGSDLQQEEGFPVLGAVGKGGGI